MPFSIRFGLSGSRTYIDPIAAPRVEGYGFTAKLEPVTESFLPLTTYVKDYIVRMVDYHLTGFVSGHG
jgi:hypothetical protein